MYEGKFVAWTKGRGGNGDNEGSFRYGSNGPTCGLAGCYTRLAFWNRDEDTLRCDRRPLPEPVERAVLLFASCKAGHHDQDEPPVPGCPGCGAPWPVWPLKEIPQAGRYCLRGEAAPYLELSDGERRFPELGQLDVSDDFQQWLEGQVRLLREAAEKLSPALAQNEGSPQGSLEVWGPRPDFPDEGYQADLSLYYQRVGEASIDIVAKKYFGYVNGYGWD